VTIPGAGHNIVELAIDREPGELTGPTTVPWL
jgi:hypothetical protein